MLGRKVLPPLGTQSREVAALDTQQVSATRVFEIEARRIRRHRESLGVGDRYAECQPFSAPPLDSLLGKRLDVCCNYVLEEGGSEPRWCLGEVTLVSNGKKNCKPPPATSAKYAAGKAVMVRWDADITCPGSGTLRNPA